MIKLSIDEVLLEYGSPLIVLARDKNDKSYVGVNYANDENGYWFYFSQAKAKVIESFANGACDLLYVVTRKHLGTFRKGIAWGDVGESVSTSIFHEFAPEFLPRPGLFIPEREAKGTTEIRAVSIDGRWGINDLRKFSDLVQDCYAFVFALTGRGTQKSLQQTEELFRKYPWRGGFSAVNFFDDLYGLIPLPEKASIQSIQYASPGTIQLNLNSEVASAIREIVDDINGEDSKISNSYEEVHGWLHEKGWLGKASKDIVLRQADKDALNARISLLTEQFGLHDQKQRLLSFSRSDPLGAVKILLAYYRRLEQLADYVATGKAQRLFSKS